MDTGLCLGAPLPMQPRAPMWETEKFLTSGFGFARLPIMTTWGMKPMDGRSHHISPLCKNAFQLNNLLKKNKKRIFFRKKYLSFIY